jgi:23S rRNA pseudouridine1911/1915/1917 synthase
MGVQGEPGDARSWRVPAELTRLRLDSFIRRCLPHLSRREVGKAIAGKHFTVNGKTAKKGQFLRPGDAVRFSGPAPWLAAQPPPDFDLDMPIVYEDSSLLALNKPAGIATHGFSARSTKTLANFLLARWPELADVGASRWEPGLVHRLDRETSGLVLAAKSQAAFEHLRLQFRRRQVVKKYLALVWGKTAGEGVVENSLEHDPGDPRRMRPVRERPGKAKRKAWRAVTRFRALGESAGMSLVEIEMRTGVTHQIRAHLASIGHPIVGDFLYGASADETFGLDRHFLHASRVEFCHPQDGRTMKLTADLPEELRDALARLGLKV